VALFEKFCGAGCGALITLRELDKLEKASASVIVVVVWEAVLIG
jgi:hypothetical protein